MLAPWPSDWFGLRGGVRVRVRVGRGRCVLGAGGELGVRGWGAWRSFVRSILRSATHGPQTRGVSQAIVIAPPCEGCTDSGAGCVRSGGMGRSCAWGRRLSDVCFQQKPKLQGIQTVVQRLSSGCLQPLPSHCLHSLARRAAVRCCVALEDGCGGGHGRGEGRLQKPQHVSRQGESERFPLHSFRHRPGVNRAGWGWGGLLGWC